MEVPVVEVQAGQSVEEISVLFKEQITKHGLCHIKGGEKSPLGMAEFYHQLSESLGKCPMMAEDAFSGAQTDGKWIEIRYLNGVTDRYRHAPVAQPVHSDGSYLDIPGHLAMMYCENAAPSGGATIFLDNATIVKTMQEKAPGLKEELENNPIKFRKDKNHKTKSILTYDEKGYPNFNFNFYCVDPDETPEHKATAKKFFDFLDAHIFKSDLMVPMYLKPGEAMAWKDDYFMHGRQAFEAHNDNDRLLYKASIIPSF